MKMKKKVGYIYNLRLKLVFFLLLFSMILSSCKNINIGEKNSVYTKEFFAMDTYMRLTVYGDNAKEAVDEAVSEIKRLDNLFSIGNGESDVSILNKMGEFVVSEETIALLETALELNKKTEGAFEVTIFPLMEEWGFTSKNYNVPSDEKINELLNLIDSNKIILDKKSRKVTLAKGMKIDFGGIAKGYTSQRLIDIFEKHNVTGALVSLGGNIQCYGKKSNGSTFCVGIKDPTNKEEYIGTIDIDNQTVITSGGYERNFEVDGVIYHHILNPDTGKPARTGILSMTIINENGTSADALSTALYVMGKEKAIQFWKENRAFDMVIVEEDGHIIITEGIKEHFVSSREVEVVMK